MEKHTVYARFVFWWANIFYSSWFYINGALYDENYYHVNVATIGNSVIFPGTMSVIVFGYFGGFLVDRKGSFFVFIFRSLSISISFLTIAFFVEFSMWLTTFMFIFVMGGLSFTKTVISKIVSSSLSEEEVASGMSLLNFTSFLSEGTGIAIV